VRVLLARGHHATQWGLQPIARLPSRYDVSLLLTRRNAYDVSRAGVRTLDVRTLRDRLPRGFAGDLAAMALRDRYRGIEAHLRSADIVHSEELSLWFSADLARSKREFGYRLVVTVWETIPMLDAFRNPHARRYREATLAAADLYLAATERAARALRLEGIPEDRIEVAYPGVDVRRFAEAREPATPPDRHIVISPGRLEWEKGHHDVLRALAAIRQGLVPADRDAAERLRVLIIGSGPEEDRLRDHAAELGIGDAVEIRSVPYDEMPSLYARASAMVLGSLPSSGCALRPGDIPRCFWEEQFGLVLVEALAAGLALIVGESGAIPEVVGDSAQLFAPGDWMAIARLLAEGPLSQAPGARTEHPADRIELFSSEAAAGRIVRGYERALGSAPLESSASSR
jgi:glycosyltransferase involved in cell wall biosynthesis